jgi:hypothetical protein
MLSEMRCAEKARRCKCPLLLSRQLTPNQHDGVKNCTRGVVAVLFFGRIMSCSMRRSIAFTFSRSRQFGDGLDVKACGVGV